MPMDLGKHCAALVRQARSNFYYAFVFLPRPKREAIFAAYAFSRRADDLVDQATSGEEAVGDLRAWREQLNACYGGRPSHPIAQNLQRVLGQFPIPKAHFMHLIDGVEMDLSKSRYATFEELYTYCYRVASAIGLICIEIFGYRNPETVDYAVNLGIALQLTNILRDVRTDAEQDRIYLPQEDLARFGYSESDLLSNTYNRPFIRLMAYQCQRARDYYARARDHLTTEDRAGLFSAEIMAEIYARLLGRIEATGYNVFDRPPTLSNLRKLTIALGIYLRTRPRSAAT